METLLYSMVSLGAAALSLSVGILIVAAIGARVAREGIRWSGATGTVTTRIPARGVGAVVVRRGGARSVSSARSIDRVPLEEGAQIVVVEVEGGVAAVCPVD